VNLQEGSNPSGSGGPGPSGSGGPGPSGEGIVSVSSNNQEEDEDIPRSHWSYSSSGSSSEFQ